MYPREQSMFVCCWAEIEDVGAGKELVEADFVAFGIEAFAAELKHESAKSCPWDQNTELGSRPSLPFLLQRPNHWTITCFPLSSTFSRPVTVELSKSAS